MAARLTDQRTTEMVILGLSQSTLLEKRTSSHDRQANIEKHFVARVLRQFWKTRVHDSGRLASGMHFYGLDFQACRLLYELWEIHIELKSQYDDSFCLVGDVQSNSLTV